MRMLPSRLPGLPGISSWTETLADGLIRPYLPRARRSSAPNELPDAIPTDVTGLDRSRLPVFEVPLSWVAFDADAHPFIKPGAPARHVAEILAGEEPLIAVAPSEDGRYKVVKGHDTLVAAHVLGLPTIHVVLTAPTPAEGAGQIAISHHAAAGDDIVPASIVGPDTADRTRSVLAGLPSRLPGDPLVRGRSE
jgi:hypothetical protein